MNFKSYILINILFISCVSFHKIQCDWLNNRPASDKSWYGIGSSFESETDYHEIARTHAYEEIASQIGSSIESSLKMVQTEINYKLYQYSEFIIDSRVNITLSSVRIVDSCSKDGRFYILAELSKSDYYREIELKKQKAVRTAVDYMTKASETLNTDSFHYLSESIKEITPFFDLPLRAEFPIGSGENINIFSQIFLIAGELNNRLWLTGDTNEIQTTIGIKHPFEFNILCRDKKTGDPVSNFPLYASMDGNLFSEHVTTDEKGLAKFNLFKVIDRTPVQYLIISPDLMDYKSKLNLPSQESFSIKVNAESPIIYLDIAEKNLDEDMNSPFVMPAVKEMFVKMYSAEFTEKKQKSDIRVSAVFETKAKSYSKNKYGLYQVYADGMISIYDTASNMEIYQKSINNVMGADFRTLKGAGRNALKKMADKITNESFHEIVDNLDNFSLNKIKEKGK